MCLLIYIDLGDPRMGLELKRFEFGNKMEERDGCKKGVMMLCLKFAWGRSDSDLLVDRAETS